MALTLIANLDPGLQCRNTLNAVIDLVGANHPWTPGSIPFTDGTGDFAQDNANFFWDATNKSLGISGSPALFKLPDVGGDNWFMAGAGNFAVSGFSNVGIGQQALIDLTSGRANLAIGSHTLQNCTTGRNNVGVGINVMSFLIAGEQNVGIGRAALDEQQDWNAVAIGDNALGNYDGPGSIGIGSNAAFNLNTGSKSIFIGYQCGSAITGPANRNVWLGGYSGSSGALSDTILFANGDGSIRALDYNFTSANTWTMTAGAALAFQGATSGTVKIDAKAVAGSWTFTLPDTAGTSGYMLSTDGAGITSWVAAGSGGGSVILSGSGVPSIGLGALGDYYVDEDGNQLYGPKEFITPIPPDQTAIPPAMTPVTNSAASVELGGYITIAVAGQITAVRYYRDASTGQVAHTVNIWTTGGTLLASASVANDGGGSGWKQVALTTPLAITAGTTIVASTDFNSVFVRTNSAAFPISNGGDLTLVSASYTGTLGSFPNNSDPANFFMDVVFNATLPATFNWPMAVDGDAAAIGATVGSATAGSVLFAGTAGVLAQNNANFYWDNTLYRLSVGSAGTLGSYDLNGVPALYEVPHLSGSNWFEGNAGNTSVTGFGNFGTGDGVLTNLSSGNGNVGIGGVGTRGGSVPTLYYNTSGSDNLALGSSAMQSHVVGDQNVAIGNSTMWAGVANYNSVALGNNAFLLMGQSGSAAGFGNVGIGHSVGAAFLTGDNNTFVGTSAAAVLTGGANNTLIGARVMANATASMDHNTWIGSYQGPALSYTTDTILLAAARDAPRSGLDRGLTTMTFGNGWYWSFGTGYANQPVGLHVYRTMDSMPGPANYERAMMDWIVTPNVFRVGTQAGGSGVVRLTAIDGFAKAGAPAAGDLPSGTFALIDDTSAGQTWLCFNKAGTIRKVQLT